MKYTPGFVTVIIPCYNQSQFLSEAIESVQRQSYDLLEIIVVNDGSTDNTTEVAKRFKNVRLIEQSNQGLARARNAGISAAGGEFLVFLDADDKLVTNALEINLSTFQKYPECVLVTGLCVYLSADGKTRTFLKQPVLPNDADYYAELLKRNYIWSPANVMFRYELFGKIKWFDHFVNPAADYELYLRTARQFAIRQHQEVITEYRQHESSMSSNPVLMLKNVLRVLEKQREHIKSNPVYQKSFKRGVRFYFFFYGKETAVYLLRSLIKLDFKKIGLSIVMISRYINLLAEYAFLRLKSEQNI